MRKLFFALSFFPASAWAANWTITIPDTIAVRVGQGICGQYKYQSTVFIGTTTVPNPQSCAQFSQQQVKNWIRDTVVSYEVNQAMLSAQNTQISSSTTTVVIP